MSQDKSLQTLYISEAILETLWLPQGRGQVESAPIESHFLSPRLDVSEMVKWEDKNNTDNNNKNRN